MGASVLGVENSRPAKVRLADAFGYPGVGCAYQHRPPYPDADEELVRFFGSSRTEILPRQR